MATTLTIQADDTLDAALRRRAEEQGKTVSNLVREILEAALTTPTLEERVGHLRGTLDTRASDDDPWRRSIRERNWRS